MTEIEWYNCDDPSSIDLFLRGREKLSDRKVRLFGCACVRGVWQVLSDDCLRSAVLTCERFADGLATADDLRAAHELANRAYQGSGDIIADHSAIAIQALCEPKPWFPMGTGSSAGIAAVAAEAWSDEQTPWDVAWDRAAREHCGLLRDIFGNPFRPVAIDPRWRTADTVALARGIYDDRAFDRLPLLADALMDAGCADEQVLGHCRSEGPHVRGCWVVDLMLGKD
jgi:hypothetical protein